MSQYVDSPLKCHVLYMRYLCVAAKLPHYFAYGFSPRAARNQGYPDIFFGHTFGAYGRAGARISAVTEPKSNNYVPSI